MHIVIAKINQELANAERSYEISSYLTKAIVLLPIVISFLFSVALVLPITRKLAMWMYYENRPIELLTFAFLFVAGIQGTLLVWQTKKHAEEFLVYGFYAIFAFGMLATAMEEVAWGQWFFGFETPAVLKDINAQGELTLHNIKALQGHSEFFRITFGLGGIFGVWLSCHRKFRKIGAPFILMSWFLIITVLAAMDLYNDYFPMVPQLDFIVKQFAEFVEMMIGMSGFLYIWLNTRMLSTNWRKNVSYRA